MKFFFVAILIFLLSACAPGQYGPLQLNPQDEILFERGLVEWQDGQAAPVAFTKLQEQYPNSPLSPAANALTQCRQELQAAHKRIAELLAGQEKLAQEQAERHREMEALRKRNRTLTEQIAALEESLELSKQIFLETESR
jgi:peptidoglycan hydrolase CwlO-like protein